MTRIIGESPKARLKTGGPIYCCCLDLARAGRVWRRRWVVDIENTHVRQLLVTCRDNADSRDTWSNVRLVSEGVGVCMSVEAHEALVVGSCRRVDLEERRIGRHVAEYVEAGAVR